MTFGLKEDDPSERFRMKFRGKEDLGAWLCAKFLGKCCLKSTERRASLSSLEFDAFGVATIVDEAGTRSKATHATRWVLRDYALGPRLWKRCAVCWQCMVFVEAPCCLLM